MGAYDDLVKGTDHLSDDELAERIAEHPDRDVLLALVRRSRGDRPTRDPEHKGPVKKDE
jgi:hypothetical protein